VRIAIEACDLWRGVYKMLRELGYHVVLANPLKIRQIAGAKKTDKVDSKTLANLLRTQYLPEVHIPEENILLLRDLTRHRAQLVRTRQRMQNMMKSSVRKEGIPVPDEWNKETKEFFRNASPYTARFMEIIDVIEVQVKRAEHEIKRIAHNNYLANILQTTPGIAEVAALMILGEIGDIKRFSHPKKLVNYAGLCPGIYQSGKKSYPTKNKACNKWLKWIIYVCSGRAVMMDTKYKDHYWKIYKKKGEKVAL
jgi:transposase